MGIKPGSPPVPYYIQALKYNCSGPYCKESVSLNECIRIDKEVFCSFDCEEWAGFFYSWLNKEDERRKWREWNKENRDRRHYAL